MRRRAIAAMMIVMVALAAGATAAAARAGLVTEIAADTNPGPSGSKPRGLTAVGDAVYFYAIGPDGEQRLWRTDGERVNRVRMVGAGEEDPRISEKIAFRGRLFFAASSPGSGRELWRTSRDGRTARVVRGARPGKKGLSPGRFETAGGKLFFRGGPRNNRELWAFDGKRIRQVTEIRPGTGHGSNPIYLTAIGDRIVFIADDGVHGAELWGSDGTVAGTSLIRDITSGSEGTNMAWFQLAGKSVYFTAITPIVGLEPWRTDGHQAQLVADVAPGSDWSSIQTFVPHDGGVFFTYGGDLWRSDDEWPSAETGIVPDNDPRFVGQMKGFLGAGADRLYFSSESFDPLGSGSPTTIRWSDGRRIGTVFDPNAAELPEFMRTFPRFFTAFAGRTLFVSADLDHGYELRSIRGNRVVPFEDILEGESSSRPRDFTRSRHFLYFTADDGIHGREIWRIRSPRGGH